MIEKPHRNGVFYRSRGGAEGFRGRDSYSPQLDTVRKHYCDNFLRTTNASTARMMGHGKMAALPLQKGCYRAQEGDGVVAHLMGKERAVAGFRYLSCGRPFGIGGHPDRVVYLHPLVGAA